VAEGERYMLSMFAPLVGDAFRIQSDEGETITVELVEAVGRAGGAGCGESPPDTGNFAIVLQDPQASVDRYLPQAVHRLAHRELGSLDLFIVPIGPGSEGQGMRYEAIFASADSENGSSNGERLLE
jgi:hypothetical protein